MLQRSCLARSFNRIGTANTIHVHSNRLFTQQSVMSTSNPWQDWLSSQSNSSSIHTLLKDKAYINGQWVSSETKDTFNVYDPATRQVISTVPNMGASETKHAINIAKEAMSKWQSLSLNQRCDICHKICILLMANQENLAHIMTAECGKPLGEAKGEVAFSAGFFKWFGEEARRTYGDVIPGGGSNERRILVTKQAVGVCGVITPWNFPLGMLARKLAPALAVGCSVVVKPAPETPLTALAIAEICEQAGVLPGVLNFITSDAAMSKTVGEEMCKNKIIRKLSFTGSTDAGMIVGAQSMSTMKRLSLELGGNAPFIVFEDANIDDAVNGALVAKFRNAGQTCVCTNRFYIHKNVKTEFVDKFTQKIQDSINVGHGLLAGISQGPLISQKGLDKVERHVNDAIENGGEIVLGGEIASVNGCEGGAFYQATVIDGMNSNCVISREETFGPIAAIYEFENEEDVIDMANDTDSGLCSYVYTNDLNRMFNISEKLEYGMVGINSGLISTEIAPFGGIKYSGLGREGSKYGIDEYLNIKYTCIDNVR